MVNGEKSGHLSAVGREWISDRGDCVQESHRGLDLGGFFGRVLERGPQGGMIFTTCDPFLFTFD